MARVVTVRAPDTSRRTIGASDYESNRLTVCRHLGRCEFAGLGASSAGIPKLSTPAFLPTATVARLPTATAAGLPTAAASRHSTIISARSEQPRGSHRSLSRFAAERSSRRKYVSLGAHAGSTVDAAESRLARSTAGGRRQAAELGSQRASPGCLPGCHEHANPRHPVDHRPRQCLPFRSKPM